MNIYCICNMSGMTYALHFLYSLLVVYKVPKVYVYRYLPLTNADPLITQKVNSDSALTTYCTHRVHLCNIGIYNSLQQIK